jgi:hypothetical protein
MLTTWCCSSSQKCKILSRFGEFLSYWELPPIYVSTTGRRRPRWLGEWAAHGIGATLAALWDNQLSHPLPWPPTGIVATNEGPMATDVGRSCAHCPSLAEGTDHETGAPNAGTIGYDNTLCSASSNCRTPCWLLEEMAKSFRGFY